MQWDKRLHEYISKFCALKQTIICKIFLCLSNPKKNISEISPIRNKEIIKYIIFHLGRNKYNKKFVKIYVDTITVMFSLLTMHMLYTPQLGTIFSTI